ncbi:MAG TPA: ABC transporter ATP-binding protein [Ignavibacteria bacterium]|nr:ABC transporter ATP-binding protein [Ignavibacteria bacterium]HMR39892.1 ABC transporter ATP-binding protein [Ignavibacteria bacterium]
MNSIEVKNLSKVFGNFISVNDISFEVKQGEVFGFLGSNGAGKSTTIKMLCGILEPTSGDALVGGFSIATQPDEVKKNIGYMSQKFSLYNDLTVSENINFFGGVYGLENKILKDRKKWVLEISGLDGREDTLTSSLSVGFKQRLALGCAVIHEPKIIFLDEPTGGVDPISRRKFWDLITDLSDKGTTVFVTTHYLDEAEFCGRIILIDAGILIAAGSPKELKKEYIKNKVIQLDCSDIYKAAEILEKENITDSISIFGNSLHLTMKEQIRSVNGLEDDEIRIITDLLSGDNDLKIYHISEISPSLEDVFLYLVEKKTADEE